MNVYLKSYVLLHNALSYSLHNVLISSEYDEIRKLGKQYHSRTGLQGPVNVLFNGMVLSEEDYDPENFEQVIKIH